MRAHPCPQRRVAFDKNIRDYPITLNLNNENLLLAIKEIINRGDLFDINFIAETFHVAFSDSSNFITKQIHPFGAGLCAVRSMGFPIDKSTFSVRADLVLGYSDVADARPIKASLNILVSENDFRLRYQDISTAFGLGEGTISRNRIHPINVINWKIPRADSKCSLTLKARYNRQTDVVSHLMFTMNF